MGVLRVMSRRGDSQVTWAKTKLEVDDPEALTAMREAERIFQEQRARGATAFKIEKGHAPVRIDQFDREAEQIVVVPRVVGRATMSDGASLAESCAGLSTAFIPRTSTLYEESK